MARGQPQGEEVYRPEVSPEDMPRKRVPEMGESPIAQGVQSFTAAVQQKFQADSATWAGDQLAAARTSAVQKLQAAKDALPAGQDPGNFTEKFLAGFDKDTMGLADSAGRNPIASSMVSKGLGELRDSLAQHVMGYEAAQRVAYRTDSVKANIKSQSDVVEAHPELAQSVGSTLMDQINAIGGDPSARLAYAREMHAQISAAAANGLARQVPRGTLDALNNPEKAGPDFKPLEGLTDAQREAVRAKANGHLSDPVFSMLANNDTRGAQGYLKQNQDILDPKTAWELQRRIDAQVKEKQNEQKQDIVDRAQDSLASAKFGLQNPITVTRAEIRLAYPKDGDRRYDGLQAVAAAGAQAREYDKMPIEAIVADVNQSEPTKGGPEAAFAIEGYEMRRRAAEQSIKAREHDPAQFAIQNNAWSPLNFKDPDNAIQELRTRANTQGQVSEQTGVNTPLLSKDEQKAMTGWLAAQPPAQRLQVLAQIRQTMPGDVPYGALMHQIAPASPLTAWAGATLDKPSSATTPSWYDPKYETSPIIGQRVLEGEQILEAKGEPGKLKASFPMPKDADLMPAFQAAAGGANSDLFRGRDQTLSTTYDAFKAAYAAQASHLGKTNGIIDSSVAQWASRQVLGNVTTYGHTTLAAPPGMPPERFEGAVEAATQVSLKAAGYSEKDVAALRGYGLRELGDTLGTGRYLIINGNGDPLKSKDGADTITIDLNRQFSHGEPAPGPEKGHVPANLPYQMERG